jgi:DNA primase
MTSTSNLFHLAAEYHRELPERIREYLHARGIADEVIDRRFLGWNGSRITIPVFNRNGICAFFRLAKDPDDRSDSPKMLSSRGSHVDLFGWEALRLQPKRVIICEGEFDRLVLEAKGFEAVTSTGGAATFRAEWVDAFDEIPEVYVCFDRDPVGYEGAMSVGRLVPHAKLVELPAEVGDGGDVTDFFVRLGKTSQDFEELLASAQPVPILDAQPDRSISDRAGTSTQLREKIDHLKREIPIEAVVQSYIELRPSGTTLVGLCPFHNDHTPSFTLFPQTRSFHCFGCGAHGDVLNFLQRVEYLSFPQALAALERLQANDQPQGESRR